VTRTVRARAVAQIITFNTMAAKAAIKDLRTREECRMGMLTGLPS